jgi:hypothetical protein
MSTAPVSSIPMAICELVKVASMGGGRGISLTSQPRGSLGAQGKPFENFAKNMFAGCLGALSSHVDAAWERTFSWRGSANHPPDFMIRSGDAVEVKIHGGIGQIQLNSSPPKRTLKVTDTRIQEGCRTCENWTEKDFLYFIGKANDEYVEALWLIDGRCIADNANTYDLIFDKLALTVSDLGGEPGNEIGRLNDVDPLKATSLRIRAMWLLEHPARVFQSVFVPADQGSFVLNVLVSAEKWDAYSKEQVDAVMELSHKGLNIRRTDIPDSGKIGLRQEAVHISWKINID